MGLGQERRLKHSQDRSARDGRDLGSHDPLGRGYKERETPSAVDTRSARPPRPWIQAARDPRRGGQGATPRTPRAAPTRPRPWRPPRITPYRRGPARPPRSWSPAPSSGTPQTTGRDGGHSPGRGHTPGTSSSQRTRRRPEEQPHPATRASRPKGGGLRLYS